MIKARLTAVRTYGSVFKARLIKKNIICAVKSLKVYQGDVEQVQKEIDIMKDMNSEHVVKYFGNFLEEHMMWVMYHNLDNYLIMIRKIIMEYCKYGSTRDIMNIRMKPLTENEIKVVLMGALHGISYLHSIKKIHRDIKSDNILLDHNAQAKLGND
jgi:serine/threonine protein kinase